VVNDDLSGFAISIKENGEEATSDADGNYSFGTVKAGMYTLIFSKDGYESQTVGDVEVKTGTAKKLNVVMLKL
jgi:uncharacterized membrane protein